MIHRDFFQGKRVAVVGLGPHGEMVTDVKHMIKSGAIVSVYDIKSEARLKNHLIFLRSLGLANYVCGNVPPDDLLDMDLIVLSHEYPRSSSFLKLAKEANVSIEYPETLFFRLAPPVTVIGVMGEFGKSTVISMLEPMLKRVSSQEDDQSFFTIDPETSNGVIAHLKRLKKGDLILIRVTSELMKELTMIRISPHVAVFTTVPGKFSYEKWPFEILSFQTYNNFIIAFNEVIDVARQYKELPRSKMLRTNVNLVPADLGFRLVGAHDKEDAALAIQAAKLFKVEDDDIVHILREWKPLRGRLEFVKKCKGLDFYNDTASIRPSSTIAAMKALPFKAGDACKSVVLILGGAISGDDYRQLVASIPEFVHAVILLPGSGTMHERVLFNNMDNVEIFSAPSIEEAVRLSVEKGKKGDRVLFSPGFEPGGDVSRKERGERFVRAIRAL